MIMKKSNSNNSVLITGCSSGFGQAIALYLAERNFQVYASMRDLSKRGPLEAKAADQNLKIRVLQLDVNDTNSIHQAVQTVVAETGGIFGVVNNAGVFIRGFFEDLLDDEIRQVFEPNLFGMMAVTRAVLPHMRAASRGRIVIISSVAGKIGSPSGSAYVASRFAQEGFAESLYQELHPLGVEVVLVEPGITKTQHWTINRGVAAKAIDPNGPYYDWFSRTQEIFNRAMDTSPNNPSQVAMAVYKALTAKRPRLRYFLGRRAKLILALRRYIPGELFERFYFGAIMRRFTTGE